MKTICIVSQREINKLKNKMCPDMVPDFNDPETYATSWLIERKETGHHLISFSPSVPDIPELLRQFEKITVFNLEELYRHHLDMLFDNMSDKCNFTGYIADRTKLKDIQELDIPVKVKQFGIRWLW